MVGQELILGDTQLTIEIKWADSEQHNGMVIGICIGRVSHNPAVENLATADLETDFFL